MNVAAEVLGRMVDTMTADNWHQGSLSNKTDTKHCLVGHMHLALDWASVGFGNHDHDAVHSAAMKALHRAAPADDGGFHLDVWNDDPHTTFEDVALVVKQAYVNELECT